MNNTSELNIYPNMDPEKVRYSFTSQDYFVHMLRMSMMVDQLSGYNILDLGCGKHTNLLKALCEMKRGPKFNTYVGVDIGKIVEYRGKYLEDKVVLGPCVDFSTDEGFEIVKEYTEIFFDDDKGYIIACFEVLEHMDFESQKRFLHNLSMLMRNTNVQHCWFSTPNFNGSAANNHICEVNYALLNEMFEVNSLDVESAIGLTTHLKYCDRVYLRDDNKQLDTRLLECTFLPRPVIKMIWANIIEPKYCNNVLYKLQPSAIKTISQDCLSYTYTYEGYRQGGNRELNCMF